MGCDIGPFFGLELEGILGLIRNLLSTPCNPKD